MKTEILNKFLSKKGQICTLTYSKPLKTKSGIKDVVIKKIKLQARAGVNYSKIKGIVGQVGESQSLPWGTWSKFPYIISHKDKEYLRFTKLNNKNSRPKVVYTLNGVEINKGELELKDLVLKSELDSHDSVVFNVNSENVEDLK